MLQARVINPPVPSPPRPLLTVYFLGAAPFNQCLQLNSGSLLNTASSIRFHLDLIYNTDGTVLAAPHAAMWLLTAFRGRTLIYPPCWLRLLHLTIRSRHWLWKSEAFSLMGFIVAITALLSDSVLGYFASNSLSLKAAQTVTCLFITFEKEGILYVLFWFSFN